MNIEKTGFHGTTKASAENILFFKNFHCSQKSNEWLGKGIYFFELQEDANWWASQICNRQGRSRNVAVAVLSALLRCTSEEYMDLDDRDCLKHFNGWVAQFLGQIKQNGEICPHFTAERRDQFWCFCCNIYKENHPEIKLISYTFNATIPSPTQFPYRSRQYCATDNSVIFSLKEVLIC